MLTPEWAHLRGASIIRGGINYRNAIRKIWLFDNFKTGDNEIKGISKYFIRKRYAIISVKTLDEAIQHLNNSQYTSLISFVGHTQHLFDDLWPYKQFLVDSLVAITKEKWLKEAEPYHFPFIGINVRLGNDFKKALSAHDFISHKGRYLRTPLEWYVESLKTVRQTLGVDLPAVLISDGSRNDLQLLLQEPRVLFSTSKSAISDLLILSKSKVLLGSGRSSFSAWASFLGDMPTLTIQGADLQEFHVSRKDSGHYVAELDPEKPTIEFTNALKSILR